MTGEKKTPKMHSRVFSLIYVTLLFLLTGAWFCVSSDSQLLGEATEVNPIRDHVSL